MVHRVYLAKESRVLIIESRYYSLLRYAISTRQIYLVYFLRTIINKWAGRGHSTYTTNRHVHVYISVSRSLIDKFKNGNDTLAIKIIT